MTLAGTRLLVLGFGVIVALAIIAGFAVVGGPDSGRQIRRTTPASPTCGPSPRP